MSPQILNKNRFSRKTVFFKGLALASAISAAVVAGSGCNVLESNNPSGGGSRSENINGCAAGFNTGATPMGSIAIGELTSGITAVAQSFELSSTTQSASVAEVVLQLKAVAPAQRTDNAGLEVDVQTDNNGEPSGSAEGRATMNAASISTSSFDSYTFSYTPSLSLVPGTKYWVVASVTDLSSTNYVLWGESSNSSLPSTSKILATFSNETGQWSQPSAFMGNAELLFTVGCLPQ